MPTIYRNKINYGGSIYLAGSGITAGIIAPFGGSTPPTGWLLCDGSAVSRTAYSQLFDAIGTTYGSGDGSTTFNVPDLRGKFTDQFGSQVNLASYSASNPYTFPADGYVVAHAGSSTSSKATANITDPDGTPTISLGGWSNGGSYPMVPVFVRKGMKGYATNTANSGYVMYTPFDSSGINYIISIGTENGGFTPITYDGSNYNGGIDNDYLLQQSTVTALSNAGMVSGSDASGAIDQSMAYIASHLGNTTTTVSAENGISGYLYLTKDKAANTIRGFGYFRKTSNISTPTNIFTLPSGWRPSGNIGAPAFLQTSSETSGYYMTVGADGTVKQAFSNSTRSGVFVMEYPIS